MAEILGPPTLPPWQQKPAWFTGSLPEWSVYWAFEKLGWKFGETVFYQSPFAGGRIQAGAVVDFYVPTLDLDIRVQGIYWHYRNSETIALDRIQKAALESSGATVIDIDEDDALRVPIEMVKDALRGISHARSAND